jgi:hypothetical protein
VCPLIAGDAGEDEARQVSSISEAPGAGASSGSSGNAGHRVTRDDLRPLLTGGLPVAALSCSSPRTCSTRQMLRAWTAWSGGLCSTCHVRLDLACLFGRIG